MPPAPRLVQRFQWKGVRVIVSSLRIGADEAAALLNILYSSQTGAIDPKHPFEHLG